MMVAAAACGGPGAVQPREELREPVAATKPHDVVSPHGTRNDPYYWLRDDTRTNPEVLAYLEAENAYAKQALAGAGDVEAALFAEMKARIPESDRSAPVFEDGYWYYDRFEPGQQHAIECRRKGTMDAPEEVILDHNQRAAGHTFFLARGSTVSPDGRYLAWAEDTVGRYQFVLRVKDLTTGELLPDTATNIETDLVWAMDGKTLFFVGKDATTLRSRYVTRHALGTPATADVVVYDEADGAYYTSIFRTKSDRYIVIHLESTLSSEARLVDAVKPDAAPVLFLGRERDHEYLIDHDGERFVIHTNWGAQNFRLMETKTPADRAAWRDVVPHDPAALIGSFAVYRDFIAWEERRGGLQRVKVLPRGKPAFTLDASDPTFVMDLEDTPELDGRAVRWEYESLNVPSETLEQDVASGARTVVDETPAPTFDRTKYVSEYVHATAADGTKVPVSLVRRRDTPVDGTAPILVYGYGSYGNNNEPRFALEEVSLLDRGWVYAIAHIRGGSEMGRAWYEHGRQLEKMNTFTDFIAVSEFLVAERYAARDKVFALGGSAGGLLMGAIVNLRPDLFRGVVATVPFVDVITTMMDETIPLTTNEYDEWGNPADRAVYEYMARYSPYDNVAAHGYPSIFVVTGLWDSQVQYFEPAKWVAKLRATRTDKNLLLFETNMSAGHGGKTGRFDRAGEWARRYGFYLHVLARPDTR
jgi:oligopeptidase B